MISLLTFGLYLLYLVPDQMRSIPAQRDVYWAGSVIEYFQQARSKDQ
jgi:hypothetical protein